MLIATVEGCSEYMASVIAQVCTLVLHDVGGATCVDPTTQRQACTALDALLKILQNVVYYYPAPPTECRTGSLDNALVKAAGTGASWLAAHATLDSFLPYFVPMVELRHFFVTSGEIKETEWMSLL